MTGSIGEGGGLAFAKYHGLGNDYLVFPGGAALTAQQVQQICDRHRGIGGDGILVPGAAQHPPFGLRIFNPDGSEAEKSGNGLRIFARFLHDRGLVSSRPFVVRTAGGEVTCEVRSTREIRVDMGLVRFAGPGGTLKREQLDLGGATVEACAADLGNPHCVVIGQSVTGDTARRLGPRIERHVRFPARTNVQFLEVCTRSAIHIEIWERGAGYTLASGSSACAAAAVSRALGQVGDTVRVRMPGGELVIEIDNDYGVRMTGPVTKVAEGTVCAEALDRDGP